MYLSVRALLTMLIATAVLTTLTIALLIPRSTPTQPPVATPQRSDAYRLAATDLTHEPSVAELETYQTAISGIAARCPKLDLIVETVRTKQALLDQSSRHDTALGVLQGVAARLPTQPGVTACSGMFNRYLVEQAGSSGDLSQRGDAGGCFSFGCGVLAGKSSGRVEQRVYILATRTLFDVQQAQLGEIAKILADKVRLDSGAAANLYTASNEGSGG